MIASTLLLLSLLTVAAAIVDVGPAHPIDPIPPRPIGTIWPPWDGPCKCAKAHCPKGFHCEMVKQGPWFFAPREPTCVPNVSPIG